MGPYTLRVEVACACEEAERCAERARRELLRQGVKVDRHATDVVLVARTADGEAAAAVRRARLDDSRRVLVAVPCPTHCLRTAVWETLEAGACDVFWWSGDGSAARSVSARLERWPEVDELMSSELVADNLIGCSEAFRSCRRTPPPSPANLSPNNRAPPGRHIHSPPTRFPEP